MKYLQKYWRQGNSMTYGNTIYNQNTIDRWTKGCIFDFPRKGDIRIAKKYWGVILTSIAAKIYNALLHNNIESEIEKILRKNQNGFCRNLSTTLQILIICQILEGVRAKNPSKLHFYLLISPRHLTQYADGRWSKYFYPTVYPGSLLQL